MQNNTDKIEMINEPDPIDNIIAEFDTITLGKMDSVKLMNRVDTKYVYSSRLIPDILEHAIPGFYILSIDDERSFHYKSVYLDTPENKMFLDHHNGKVNRYKIRFREYVSSKQRYLEIKFKTKNSRTVKNRIKRKNIENILTGESKDFIEEHTPFNPDNLEQKITTHFNRITLVNKTLTERVTIDYALSFAYNSHNTALSKLCITEIKKDGNSTSSDFDRILSDFGIIPKRMSKYCIGRVLLDRKLKYNNFKERLLTIDKITKNDNKLYSSCN